MPLIHRLQLRNEATSWTYTPPTHEYAEIDGVYEEIEFSNDVVQFTEPLSELYEKIFFESSVQLDAGVCDLLAGVKLSDLGHCRDVQLPPDAEDVDLSMRVTFNLDDQVDEDLDSDEDASYHRRQTNSDCTLLSRRISCVSILSGKRTSRRDRVVPKLSSLCTTILANNVINYSIAVTNRLIK